MRFIYATRPQPRLEFAVAKQREAMPTDAEVYAMCDRALTIRQQNKVGQLTVAEQSMLNALIAASQQAEEVEVQRLSTGEQHLVRRIWRRLFNF
jgi:hypothetical protein